MIRILLLAAALVAAAPAAPQGRPPDVIFVPTPQVVVEDMLRLADVKFDMGDWKPEKKLETNGRVIYFWTIPEPSMRR